MLTFGLSLASAVEPEWGAEPAGRCRPQSDGSRFSVDTNSALRPADAGEPDPSGVAASRGAGGGRGGVDRSLVAAALRSVEDGLRFGLRSSRRFPGAIRTDGGRNVDVRWTAVSRFLAAGVAAGRPEKPGLDGDPTLGLRLAKLFVAGGERGSPHSTRGDEALKDLPASGVDDEALIPGRAGADVGEIDPWPAHERRNQSIPLGLKAPFDLARRCASPRRQPLGPGRGDGREGDEPADRRTRQAKAQRSIHPSCHA